MKKVFFFWCLSIISVSAFCQWPTQNPWKQDPDSNSVFFTNAGKANTRADVGPDLKSISTDTGWVALSSGTTSRLNSVFFTDASTGYIAGNNGIILKTTIGGGPYVAVEEHKSPASTFNIYPNPANSKITIEQTGNMPGETNISISDVKGEPVIQDNFQNQNLVQKDVSMLPKVIYLVKIQTREGVESKKLVIR